MSTFLSSFIASRFPQLPSEASSGTLFPQQSSSPDCRSLRCSWHSRLRRPHSFLYDEKNNVRQRIPPQQVQDKSKMLQDSYIHLSPLGVYLKNEKKSIFPVIVRFAGLSLLFSDACRIYYFARCHPLAYSLRSGAKIRASIIS